jgi:hypothetical protein
MPSIIRVVHDRSRPYLQLSRETIKDARQDLAALGLLVDLLARPDDWKIAPRALADELGVSARTVYRLLGKLIGMRYVDRVDVTRRLADGKFERRCCYSVFEGKVPPSREANEPGKVCNGAGVANADIPF